MNNKIKQNQIHSNQQKAQKHPTNSSSIQKHIKSKLDQNIHPNTNISVREGEDTSFLGVCGGGGRRGSGLLCRCCPHDRGTEKQKKKDRWMDVLFV